jgi:hypothetical protein
VVQRIEGARLRTLRSEFNSLHPFHLSEGSAPLRCCALANRLRSTALALAHRIFARVV